MDLESQAVAEHRDMGPVRTGISSAILNMGSAKIGGVVAVFVA